MQVISRVLMFFLTPSNVILMGMLLFCRSLRPRYSVLLSVATILAYFVAVNLWSSFVSPLLGSLQLFGWLDPVFFAYPVLSWLVYLLAFDIGVGDSLFVATASVAMQHMNYHLAMIVFYVTALDMEGLPYRTIFFFMSIAVYALLWLLFIRRTDVSGRVKMDGKSLLVFALITVTIALVFNQYARAAMGDYASEVYHIAMVFGCVCLLMLMLRAFRETKAEYDKRVIETLLDADKTKQEYSKEAIELVNRKYHDIRRELAAVRAENAPSERLDSLDKELNIYGLVANTGNRVLDALLAEKTLLCKKYEIDFSYVLRGDELAFIDSVDLYCMLGNVLDNAIEYLRTVPTEMRIMTLNARADGNMLFITEENVCRNELRFGEDGLPETTKRDKLLHGYGTKSIKYVAEKYGGSVVVTSDGKRYRIDIVLFRP